MRQSAATRASLAISILMGGPIAIASEKPAETAITNSPAPLIAPFAKEQANEAQKRWAGYLKVEPTISNSIGMKLVLIPPGEFMMGSPANEAKRGNDEENHRVRIAKPFLLGMHEVTQAEFARITRRQPSWFSEMGKGAKKVSEIDVSRHPVEMVTWFDAIDFCNRLSEREGLRPSYELSALVRGNAGHIVRAKVREITSNGYRLPTEAEWEYACRAGSASPFHFGTRLDGRDANVLGDLPYGTVEKGPYLERTTTVGTYVPNGFGLFDMHGNVWEWCGDWYREDYAKDLTVDQKGLPAGEGRVVRGGSWFHDAAEARSAKRLWDTPDARTVFTGFRIARSQ